jgi:hypothetical protein
MWSSIVMVLLIALVVLFQRPLFERLGALLKLECRCVNWVDSSPLQCRLSKWHTGSHASAWHATRLDAADERRVRWYDGELGQASAREYRYKDLTLLVLLFLVAGCARQEHPVLMDQSGVERIDPSWAGLRVWDDTTRGITCYQLSSVGLSCVKVRP